MRLEYFQAQSERLMTRFGSKALDQEFLKLAWREVHDMSESGFLRFVDVLIGSRPHNKPPLLSEFREARLNEQKTLLQNVTAGASQAIARQAPEEMRKHLKLILNKEYGPGVDSAADAAEVSRLRQMRDGKDPA